MSDAPSPSSTSDGRQVMVRKRRDPKSRLAAIFNIPLEEPRAELEEERPSAWEPEPWVPLSFRAPPPPFLSQSASEAPSFPPLYSPISGPSLLNVGDEVVENVPTPRRRASSAFSTVSLPSPSQHPRAWSPPPAQHAEEQSEPQPVHPKDSARLRNYSKRRCELLDILSDLHSTGVQSELDLPRIVVVGSQSVGKSSLIESMCDVTLPRDSGTCTRCPMECRLQNAPAWSCTIVLRFLEDSSGRPLDQMREVPFGPTLYDKAEVEKVLRRAQRAILRPTLIHPSVFLNDSDLTTSGHPALTFSANCVCLRVAGPEVPDLYFYDLPGIIVNVGDGGNEGDIKLVEKLARKYISKPNCIVLLVISCETDFENQGAGRLVLKDSKLKKRTVGVLTKPDRIEDGAAVKWLQLFQGKENRLPWGWFCVKQPDLLELKAGISREDAKASEKQFFESTAPWSRLDHHHRSRLGSEGLADQLGKKLADLVDEKLPQIQLDVLRQLEVVNKELDGLPYPKFDDPRREILTLLRDFSKKISKHIEGLPPSSSNNSRDLGSLGLIHSINEASERFRREVHQTAPRFRPWSSKAALTDTQRYSMTATASQDNAEGAALGPIFHVDEIMDLAKRSRTRELPGNYPFSVKENLISESVKQWVALTDECFEEIRVIVTDHIDRLIQEHFAYHKYGGLLDAISKLAHAEIQKRLQITEESIRNLCLTEEKPYTQNEDYFFSYRSDLLARYRSIYRESCGQGAVASILQSYNPLSQGGIVYSQWQHVNTAISSLAALGIHGVMAGDLIKLLPGDGVADSALEIMAEVRAYFQVAYKRFGDTIPNQIDADFVRGLENGLDLALRYMDVSTETCLQWLQESPIVSRRRSELIGKKKRLESAKEKLGVALRV